MKQMRHFIFIFLSIITLILLIATQKRVQQYFSKAAPQSANIVIDTTKSESSLSQPWSNFAQGGEEPNEMLSKTVSPMKELNPQYVRIDHVFDYFVRVEKNSDDVTYNFSELDKTIDNILAMGALPFLNLSYMPKIFTSGNSVIEQPQNWQDWTNLIRATIEHYSGKKNRNISNMYYEIWNEPELPQFGAWKLSSHKDYRLLYYYAIKGAEMSLDTNQYSIGGPSVGSYYSKWVTDFLSYVEENNLRLDFYSWHRYNTNPSTFLTDAKNIHELLSHFSRYRNIPIILSEWGIDSENSEMNNSNRAAAFTIATVKNFPGIIDRAFVFEIKDGPPPQGGKWGLLRHENDSSPLSPKPRYLAFQSLSRLQGKSLPITGEGTYVSALATVQNNVYSVLLNNYDPKQTNIENVPVTFTNLSSGEYVLSYEYPLTGITSQYTDTVTTNTLTHTFPLQPNTFIFLKLSLATSLADISHGVSGGTDDFSLRLDKLASPLTYTSSQFHLENKGSVDFDIQPLTDTKNGSFYIFEMPYTSTNGAFNKLALSEQVTSKGVSLVLTTTEGFDQKIAYQIEKWEKNSWHRISARWDTEGLYLTLDNKNFTHIPIHLTIETGKTIIFSPSPTAIDNLIIQMNGKIILERHFNIDADS